MKRPGRFFGAAKVLFARLWLYTEVGASLRGMVLLAAVANHLSSVEICEWGEWGQLACPMPVPVFNSEECCMLLRAMDIRWFLSVESIAGFFPGIVEHTLREAIEFVGAPAL
jgi:hypothetical protein